MIRMARPVHPGQFIKMEGIQPLDLPVTSAAEILGVTRPALSALLNGRAQVGIDDLQELAVVGLAHRIVPAQTGSGDQVALAQELVREIVATVPVPV